MSFISKGSQIASAVMTIVTLTVTGVAVFASGLTSQGNVTAPAFIATSTNDGIVMQGGGDINASSTNSDILLGGTVTSSNQATTGISLNGQRMIGRFGRASSSTIEYIGTADGCSAVIYSVSTTAPTYNATSTAFCNP